MAPPFLRVDIWNIPPTDPIVDWYGKAVAAMQAKPSSDPTSWAYQAAIHGTMASSPLPQWNECRHATWFFVSWHRMYLYYFERIVRAQVIALGGPSDWALPFWDYDGGGTRNTLPTAFRNALRPDGTPNPLFVNFRRPAINAGAGLPSTITSPTFALARTLFSGPAEFGGGITSAAAAFWSQTGRLEQTPHNDVHVAIGGWMGNPDTAAQDPIFWLHHANIDRLWWLWQQTHTDPTVTAWTGQSFSFMDAGGVAASKTDADVVDTLTQLDYTYKLPVLHVTPPHMPKPPSPQWPAPWPTRPTPATEAGRVPRETGREIARSLVGATEQPIVLLGGAVRATVAIDARATQSIKESARVGEPQQGRAFLDVEDIEAERNPETVYGVYVNLPAQPSGEDLAAHHAGNISLFGVERARNPRGDEHAHGLRVSMEITDLLDRMAASGTWHQGTQLDVTFRPIGLEMPAGVPAAARESAAVTHPNLPITIGRVSVHLA